MGKMGKTQSPPVVALRTAIIIPKAIRNRLGLQASDLLEIEVKGRDLVLHPRPVGCLVLQGVPATSLDKLTGLVKLGGDAVKDKKKLYER